MFKLGVSTLNFALALLHDANGLSALERDSNPERNFEKIRETGREKREIEKYEGENNNVYQKESSIHIYSNHENHISKPVTRDAKQRGIRGFEAKDGRNRSTFSRKGEIDPELSGYISVGGFSGAGSLWDYFLNREPEGWKRDLRDDVDYFIPLSTT